MELFDIKYVYYNVNKNLVGKECFISDSIKDLIYIVNSNSNSDKKIILGGDFSDSPFMVRSIKDDSNIIVNYRFAYYDPYYELKLALKKGKTIQYQMSENGWIDVENPIFNKDISKYRVKPKENLMTNIQLSEWLAKGNGCYRLIGKELCMTFVIVSDFNKYDKVPSDFVIRRWNTDDWIKPTEDIYLQDCC